MISKIVNLFKRVHKSGADFGDINNVVYNDHAGADKVIIVEPVVKKAVLATDTYPFGSYVKVTGTTYTLDLLNHAYNPASFYKTGAMVTNGGNVYVANPLDSNPITGAFDASKWTLVSTKQIGPVTITAGSVVCCGKYHNTVGAAGFLIEDDTEIKKASN